jgi:hypothetical protein
MKPILPRRLACLLHIGPKPGVAGETPRRGISQVLLDHLAQQLHAVGADVEVGHIDTAGAPGHPGVGLRAAAGHLTLTGLLLSLTLAGLLLSLTLAGLLLSLTLAGLLLSLTLAGLLLSLTLTGLLLSLTLAGLLLSLTLTGLLLSLTLAGLLLSLTLAGLLLSLTLAGLLLSLTLAGLLLSLTLAGLLLSLTLAGLWLTFLTLTGLLPRRSPQMHSAKIVVREDLLIHDLRGRWQLHTPWRLHVVKARVLSPKVDPGRRAKPVDQVLQVVLLELSRPRVHCLDAAGVVKDRGNSPPTPSDVVLKDVLREVDHHVVDLPVAVLGVVVEVESVPAGGDPERLGACLWKRDHVEEDPLVGERDPVGAVIHEPWPPQVLQRSAHLNLPVLPVLLRGRAGERSCHRDR